MMVGTQCACPIACDVQMNSPSLFKYSEHVPDGGEGVYAGRTQIIVGRSIWGKPEGFSDARGEAKGETYSYKTQRDIDAISA